jgi:hypothetical protein
MKMVRASGRLLFSTLAVLMLVGLAACPATTPTSSPTPPAQPVLPGISYFSTSLQDLDEAAAGVDVEVYVMPLNLYLGSVPVYTPAVIYYYDVTPPTTQGQPATTAPGSYIEVVQEEDAPANWRNVPPGMHTFSAQLVNADYTPMDPPVVAQARVLIPAEITQQMPALQSMSAQASPPVPGNIVEPLPSPSTTSVTYYEATVTASVYNFKLNDDNIGKANVPGEGHYIYYLDAAPPTTQGQPAFTAPGSYRISASHAVSWNNVPVGEHTLAVQLVNNDNTPLEPAVIMETTLTMPAEPYG